MGKDYAVLSYVIGDTNLPSYSREDFDAFKDKGIDVSSLPQTYQNAIKVVKMLDPNYLWVDAVSPRRRRRQG
jgi:Heterokaryon incompatibility protein (HET)